MLGPKTCLCLPCFDLTWFNSTLTNFTRSFFFQGRDGERLWSYLCSAFLRPRPFWISDLARAVPFEIDLLSLSSMKRSVSWGELGRYFLWRSDLAKSIAAYRSYSTNSPNQSGVRGMNPALRLSIWIWSRVTMKTTSLIAKISRCRLPTWHHGGKMLLM